MIDYGVPSCPTNPTIFVYIICIFYILDDKQCTCHAIKRATATKPGKIEHMRQNEKILLGEF